MREGVKDVPTLWIIFEIGINLFQSSLYLFFLKSRSHISKPSKVADWVCVLTCTAFYTLYLFFDIPITDSVHIIFLFIYLLIVSDDPWYVSAFWVLVKEAIAIAIVGLMLQLCLILTPGTYEVLMSQGPLRFIFVMSTNLAMFFVMFFFSKMKRTYSPVEVSALLLFLATNLSVLFAIEMLFSLQAQASTHKDWHIFAAYGALFLCSAFSVWLYHFMTQTVQKENAAQIALKQAQLTKEHQQALQDMYSDMLARQHDFKHQLQAIEQLIQQQPPQAAEYLAKYKERISERNTFVTGSIAVDALLTAKMLACKNKCIDFELSQCPLTALPICEVDFCAIVGNLLDNAMEGTLRIKDAQTPKWIHLSFQRVWNTFSIRCENTMAPSTINRRGKRFLTSKSKCSAPHGFGIPNIESIAQKAEGFCSFEMRDCIFIATITLPYPTGEKNESTH